MATNVAADTITTPRPGVTQYHWEASIGVSLAPAGEVFETQECEIEPMQCMAMFRYTISGAPGGSDPGSLISKMRFAWGAEGDEGWIGRYDMVGTTSTNNSNTDWSSNGSGIWRPLGYSALLPGSSVSLEFQKSVSGTPVMNELFIWVIDLRKCPLPVIP